MLHVVNRHDEEGSGVSVECGDARGAGTGGTWRSLDQGVEDGFIHGSFASHAHVIHAAHTTVVV